MPRTKPQIDVNEVLRQMGGGMFRNPFSGDFNRDPKNYYASVWDAYDKMLAWDPEIATVDKNARLAVLAHDTEIVPATDDAESRKAADFCIEMVSNIKNFEDIRYDLGDSPAKGLAVIQKNVVRDGGYYTVADNENGPALQTLPQHWFYWKMVEGRPRLVYRGLYGGRKDEPLDEELFIIARHGYTVENPYGRGYLTEAFWTFVKKKILQGYMLQLCERGVEPERRIECTPDDLGKMAWDMKDDIRQALDDFARHSDMILPPGVNLNYQPGDAGALQSELNFTHLLDNYIAKVTLGQTLTTDQGRTGTYSQALIHELQQSRKIISWCKDQMADLNDQLLTPICELNFNVGRAKFRIKYEKERDRKEEAEIWNLLGKTIPGFTVDKEYAHFTFDIPEPEENAPPEEVYELKSGGGGGGDNSFGGLAAASLPTQKKNLTALATKAARQNEARRRIRLIDDQVARHVALVKGTIDRRFKIWRKLIDKSKSYSDLTARVESRERDWPAFADALRTATVASYALGMATQATELRVEAAAVATEPGYDTWEDVLREFRGKVPIDAATFYALELELRPKYFATAIVEDEYMATMLQELMAKAMEGGETFAAFKAGAYEAMRAGGYTFPEPYHLETVFRRHLSTADAAAREEWYSIPEIDEMIWGFEYLTSGRPNVRPEHAALNHTKLPKDHPFWFSNTPPIDYGCNCIKVEVPAEGRPKENEPPDNWRAVPNYKEGFGVRPGDALRAMPT